MARRSIGWLVAVAAATAIAGCGGDEESGFIDATNATCQNVSAAAKTLSTDLVRGPGESEAAAVKAAIKRYAATVTAAADELEAAKPTKAEREFQQRAVAHLREQAKDLTAAAEGGDGGGDSRADAVKRLTASMRSSPPMVPPTILAGAPACAEESAAR